MFRSREPRQDAVSEITQLSNYYERLVFDAIAARGLDVDDEAGADIACIALNELPAKYIRHEVDMAYFTDPVELDAMRGRVARAVDVAIGRVLGHCDTQPSP